MAIYQEIRKTVARLRDIAEKHACRNIERHKRPTKIQRAQWNIIASAAGIAITVTLEPYTEKRDVSTRANCTEARKDARPDTANNREEELSTKAQSLNVEE